ncbi:Protein of unknown function (DUF2927) [Gillisia mitskevichiae]|uniref:Uncharacterized protein n=2 Tax=Gillisia mitskevichiae TaxID=270921 RepID=A0A495PXK0_9FLAO|nr:Protein of unknown function (DUF2927) [Gillisia mitskevichiae]
MLIFTFSMTIYSQSRKEEQLKTDYIESAFLEYDTNNLPIIKWENKDTLKVHIAGEFEYMSKKRWEKYLNKIEDLVNIKIVETKNIAESDIKIFFGELDAYFANYKVTAPKNVNLTKFDNWNSRNYNSEKQLTNTSYCIVPSKTRDSKRGSFNIKKTFLKSLGILGELENDFSILNRYQTDNNTQLSKNDKRIINIHYNNSIKAGMNMDEIKIALNSIDIPAILEEKF